MFIEDLLEKLANGEGNVENTVDDLLGETTVTSNIATVPIPLPCTNKKDPACRRDKPCKACQDKEKM